MADLDAIRQRLSKTSLTVDIAAIRSSAKLRAARRSVRSEATSTAIQRHAEAIGRGEPSVSPVKARVHRTG
jgi:hypothetical protein